MQVRYQSASTHQALLIFNSLIDWKMIFWGTNKNVNQNWICQLKYSTKKICFDLKLKYQINCLIHVWNFWLENIRSVFTGTWNVILSIAYVNEKLNQRSKKCSYMGFKYHTQECISLIKISFDINLENLLGLLFEKLIRPENGSLQYILGIYIITCKSQNLRQ